jgi:hypothetical protein
MLPCVQKCFQIAEEGKTYNAVHSCITLCKIYMEKYSNKTSTSFQYKITDNRITSRIHFLVLILINKPDTFNMCKFIVRDVHYCVD